MPKSRPSSKKSQDQAESTRPRSQSPTPPSPPPQQASTTTSTQAPTSPSTSTSTAPTTATKRLLHELSDQHAHPNPALLHLGPVSDEDLLDWEAVLKGPPPSTRSPYTNGLWLLSIQIPPSYPRQPPKMTFQTPICHPNVSATGGEICLSLLTSEHWSPMYTVSSCLVAVQQLIFDPDPVVDSPFNVDVANLYREGDRVGAHSLVRFWTAEARWKGEGRAGWISEYRQPTAGNGG